MREKSNKYLINSSLGKPSVCDFLGNVIKFYFSFFFLFLSKTTSQIHQEFL